MDIFHYDFMQRAFFAALAVGIVAPLIGTFLVARRYSLIADSLAHVSLSGVAVGLLLGVNPLLGALVMAVAAALIIEKLRADRRITADLALATFLSSGLAIAIVLISIAEAANVDLFSFLFGSITTVGPNDVWILGILTVVVVATVTLLYKELAYVVFDEEQAKVSGLPTKLLNQVLIMLAAITVVLALRIVGGLLIGALMVLPVAIAMQVAASLRQTIVVAIISGLSAAITGLLLSFYLGLPAGGTIVLVALGIFLVVLVLRRLIGRSA